MKSPSEAKAAELGLMLAIKTYVDFLVADAVRRHGMEAVPSAGPQRTAHHRWVYFIQGEAGGPIKIGVANDPEKRLTELQRTSPVRLVLLGKRPGDSLDEKRLHLQFADRRLHGEWFEPCDEILDVIAEESVAA